MLFFFQYPHLQSFLSLQCSFCCPRIGKGSSWTDLHPASATHTLTNAMRCNRTHAVAVIYGDSWATFAETKSHHKFHYDYGMLWYAFAIICKCRRYGEKSRGSKISVCRWVYLCCAEIERYHDILRVDWVAYLSTHGENKSAACMSLRFQISLWKEPLQKTVPLQDHLRNSLNEAGDSRPPNQSLPR